jgi:hypothetical protein
MFGKKSCLNPLESRKRLLIAESEINRARLLKEWQTLTDGVGTLADRATSFKSMTASIISLAAGLMTFTGGQPAPDEGKSSWLHKIAGTARLASTIWLAVRSRGSDSGKK